MTEHTISKSQYVKGLQCPKALWFYRHRKDLASEVTPDKQARFDTGHQVGRLAMQYFGDGVEVTNEFWDVTGAVTSTEEYIEEDHNLIFEATAIHKDNGCYAKIDILRRVEGTDEWDMIEVKSSTSVKDYHINDMSFQYYVFCGAGYKIRNCFIMVLNNGYVRDGDIDLKQLLKLEEISSAVRSKQGEVHVMAGDLERVLEEKVEPSVSIGTRCSSPFECDYKDHCWAHVPEYSVYDVFSKSKVDEISSLYGVEIEGLPDHVKPTKSKVLDVQCYLSKKTHVDVQGISEFLMQITYPVYFLDYESFMPAIPLFDGMRPYQHIPFQFSIHVESKLGEEPKHQEFLHQEQSDPRKHIAEKLVEYCGNTGTVLVYNKSFEITRNKELAQEFPKYSDAIEAINSRVVDLLEPFRKRLLYDPEQRSSASIKNVLPCFSDMSYADLEISDGGEAMLQYAKFMAGEVSEGELDALWKDLSIYCSQDTYGMVLLLRALRERV